MNAPAAALEQAERHRFTADEVIRMVEVGLLDPDARTELIDGELIDMPSEGEPHIRGKAELIRWFNRNLPDAIGLAPDATLHLSPTDAPEPDFYLFDAGVRLKPVDPAAVRLVVEIADSSAPRDLGPKAALYARYGLTEYWVVDLAARATHVHRAPEGGAYPEPRQAPFEAPLAPAFLPELTLTIAALPGFGDPAP